ncbi:hypothetical protein CMV_018999 [Castanea mollissima]|uniref:Isopenicillin N synthase-like Fe(2+) 2OG dioxygenase domain-containing protein n=1 Tax=Castanea mollissima TaxID=60419 RepID=A0A8J4QQW2_9ROSI|nr:hypothetical protein CMV_018999 [Castanea mollissima]
MVDTHLHQNSVQDVLDYDREKELKDFDDTKAGVKGLVDTGIVKIPQMFVIPTNELSSETSYSGSTHLHIPVIDLKDIHEGKSCKLERFFVFFHGSCCSNPEEFPSACRDIIISYSEHVKMLRLTLLELLSEALGLKPNHLIEMGCAAGHNFENQWADIPPVIGALVVNLGDLFQLISNDKFKSAIHRVLANQVGPRISVACFFSTHLQPVNQLYGPIKELLSDDNPPLYRETLVGEYAFSYALKGLGNAALALFRL